jgi:hypothetical protein
MPIYTNKYKAERYWTENLKFEEFHGTKRENEIMKQKIEEALKNGVLLETFKNSICWYNWYRLVPKANEDMQLVVDMREVNQFLVFKMEGTPTLEERLHNLIRFEGSLQPHTYASHTSGPIGNTIYGNYI